MNKILFQSKIRASSIHLAISFAFFLVAAGLVFGFWFPYPYREISGGRDLFLLIVSVDVALGPLITFVAFNPGKPRREKIFEFCIIGFLQLGGLLYGLWSVAQARPLHMVFEYNRFRVVHVIDIPPEMLIKAPTEFRVLPWSKPTYLSLRPMGATEQMEMTLAAFTGVPLAARPELWQPYEAAHAQILHESLPAMHLKDRFADQSDAIDQAVAETGRPIERLRYLPLLSRKVAWTVLIDAESAWPVGFVSVDPF